MTEPVATTGDEGRQQDAPKRASISRRTRRLATWKLEGLPEGLGTFEWLFAASFRMPGASWAALGAAWTAAVVALWVGALAAIISVVFTAFGVTFSGHIAGVLNLTSHSAGGLVFLGALAAGAVGFGAGFAGVYTSSTVGAIPIVATGLLIGIIIGLIFGLVATVMEPRLLAWRGYRRPSAREREEKLDEAAATALTPLQLTTSAPYFFIMETPVPQAWTYARSIVISKGLLDGLSVDELAAVLSHELTHWRRGDGLALRMVWCFGWPIGILYSVGMFLQGARFGQSGLEAGASETPHSSGKSTMKGATSFVALVSWMILWPSWLLTKFVLVPATARESRAAEYEADAGARAIGLGDDLKSALERIRPWEGGRNAWDAAIAASHPPTELRLEALDGDSPEQDSIHVPTDVTAVSKERAWFLGGALLILAFLAFAHYIPSFSHHNAWW